MSSSAEHTDREYDDAVERPHDRRSVVSRQKEEHGGIKVGSAFFGFLTAVGVGVLLTWSLGETCVASDRRVLGGWG